METLCYKIKLKKGSLKQVRQWAEQMNIRAGEVFETLSLEGVYVESVFLEKSDNNYYLIYFVKAESLNDMREFSKNSTLPIEKFHKDFKRTTFESSAELESLIDFDRIKAKSSGLNLIVATMFTNEGLN
ncbi:hypothetical protein HC864_05685 [Candidatus Gracilibacteria bacterium]|nr:hypothetical protein [Candidatus Gracilibacteria bacterium]